MTRPQGWMARLRAGLSGSAEKITGGVARIFTNHRLDESALEQLEELLIASDMGVPTASRLVGSLERHHFHAEISPDQLREILSDSIAAILEPLARPLNLAGVEKPFVILMVGVNGSGKTTTAGKLAKMFIDEGRKVLIAAADTFRAAAREQLEAWASRAGADILTGADQSDPAALAHDAYKKAKKAGHDVLLIDTAGRLSNKTALMAELQKIAATLKKIDAAAPHAVLLVLDATTGQNALAQVDAFRTILPLSGLVMTKFDGSAQGGVLVAIAEQAALPIHAVGVGEGIDDLRAFSASAFADSLMGVER